MMHNSDESWKSLFSRLVDIVLGPYLKLFRVLEGCLPDNVPTEHTQVLLELLRQAERVVDAAAGRNSVFDRILDEVRRQMPTEAAEELVTDSTDLVDGVVWTDIEMD